MNFPSLSVIPKAFADALARLFSATAYVTSGLVLTAQGVGTLQINVAAGGGFTSAGSFVYAGGNVIPGVAAANPRYDLVVVLTGAAAPSIVAGAASVTPVPPALPVGALLLGYAFIPGAAIDYTTGGFVADYTMPFTLIPFTTKGDVLTFSNVIARLGIGANGRIFTADSTQATGNKWGQGPLTTDGDLLVGATAGTPTRLPMGAALQVLRVNAGVTGLEYAAGSAAIDRQLFTASGTWTKPAGAKNVLVIAIGAGGGGGGGEGRAGGNARNGGAAGGAGAYVARFYDASALGANETVTIGAGGAGGAGGNGAIGSPSGAAGTTTFGAHLTAFTGGGGGGGNSAGAQDGGGGAGTAGNGQSSGIGSVGGAPTFAAAATSRSRSGGTGGTGGTAPSSAANDAGNAENGGGGGGANSSVAGAGQLGAGSLNGGGGGGGGGSVTVGNVESAGGAGGATNTYVTGGGGAGGGSGNNAGTAGTSRSGTGKAGDGGGGGGGFASGNGPVGGAGGVPGGSGGGGGAGTSIGGTGGLGGRAEIIVYSW